MASRVARTKQTRLLIESLEARCTPAGNVAAVLSGTTLVITGDAQDNQIQIINPPSYFPIVLINGLSGTQVNGASSAWFPASAVNSIVIQMGQGNDEVYLGGGPPGLGVPGSLNVDLGAGDDELLFINTTVNGSTTIRGRAGNDDILFNGFNTLKGSVLADLAQGNDRFEASDDSFNKSLTILGGAGNDGVIIDEGTTVGGTFNFQGQAGDDSLFALTSTFKKLVVDTGAGNDSVQLGGSPGDGINVLTSATVLLGGGNDALLVGHSTFGSTFFDGGPGMDTFSNFGGNTFGSPSSIVNFP
jgi:Ca2+-binding RTX toxin-like protein